MSMFFVAWLSLVALDGSVTRDEIPSATAHAPAAGLVWNARNAEHLLNRAGFGARQADVTRAVAEGPEALVERLLTRRADREPPFYERLSEPTTRALKELSEDDQKAVKREYSERDKRQLLEVTGWWLDSMVRGDDPLLDRMTLFWHGFFTSSIDQVRKSYPILLQHEFLRRNALGSYADLLRGIVHDPAMLIYLNNTSNRKGNPNENLARELMELFSLGLGNYTEADVKDAARALTGHATTRDGDYEYRPKSHDDGAKTILGVTGKHDADDLVGILLKQDACPRFVARRILTYLEGVEPDAARLAEYATCLRANDFQMKPFLRKLFLDPDFYRDEVVGARVAGPVDFVVGTARRLGLDAPAMITGSGAALLGQRIFAPPSVKGWDEGLSWITTSSLMQRGNWAGMVVGVVSVDDVLNQGDLLAREVEGAAKKRADAALATDGRPAAPAGSERTNAGAAANGAAMSGTERSGAATTGSAMTGEAMTSSGNAADESMMQAGARKDAAASANPAMGSEMSDPMTQEQRDVLAKRLKSGKKGSFAYDALRRALDAGWAPSIHFKARLERAGCKTDEQIVDQMLSELLAIAPPAETRARMLSFVLDERVQLSVRDGHLLEADGDAERVLRRLAHLILSLPEAQLL